MKHEQFKRLAKQLGAKIIYERSPCAAFVGPAHPMVVSVDFESELDLLNTPDLTTIDALVGAARSVGLRAVVDPGCDMDFDGGPGDGGN